MELDKPSVRLFTSLFRHLLLDYSTDITRCVNTFLNMQNIRYIHANIAFQQDVKLPMVKLVVKHVTQRMKIILYEMEVGAFKSQL